MVGSHIRHVSAGVILSRCDGVATVDDWSTLCHARLSLRPLILRLGGLERFGVWSLRDLFP
jgi:hypothetical protein